MDSEKKKTEKQLKQYLKGAGVEIEKQKIRQEIQRIVMSPENIEMLKSEGIELHDTKCGICGRKYKVPIRTGKENIIIDLCGYCVAGISPPVIHNPYVI